MGRIDLGIEDNQDFVLNILNLRCILAIQVDDHLAFGYMISINPIGIYNIKKSGLDIQYLESSPMRPCLKP